MEVINVVARDIKEGDAGKILNLVEACGPYVAPYNVYAYWILENYYFSTCKVVEDNNIIIGFISGMPSMDKGSIFIWQLCVHNDYRGKGVATLLLDSLFQTARERKFEKMELSISEDNYDSQSLFKSYSKRNNLNITEKNRCVFGDVIEIVYEIRLI